VANTDPLVVAQDSLGPVVDPPKSLGPADTLWTNYNLLRSVLAICPLVTKQDPWTSLVGYCQRVKNIFEFGVKNITVHFIDTVWSKDAGYLDVELRGTRNLMSTEAFVIIYGTSQYGLCFPIVKRPGRFVTFADFPLPIFFVRQS
jgi:hypothetical protein